MPVRDTKPRRTTRPSVPSTWSARHRGPVLAVVEAAEHVGLLEVAVLEGDQHLVVDLGQDDDASLGRRPAAPCAPSRLVRVGQPRERDLDPALLVGVLDVGDDGGHDAADPRPRRGARVVMPYSERSEVLLTVKP